MVFSTYTIDTYYHVTRQSRSTVDCFILVDWVRIFSWAIYAVITVINILSVPAVFPSFPPAMISSGMILHGANIRQLASIKTKTMQTQSGVFQDLMSGVVSWHFHEWCGINQILYFNLYHLQPFNYRYINVFKGKFCQILLVFSSYML